MIEHYSLGINVGGKEYVDSKGKVWNKDKAYSPGSWGCLNFPRTDILTTTDPILNTENVTLFQTIRMGERLIYRFDLQNGEYGINLLFAEIYWETGAAEQQDVYIQNRRVLRFNIFDEVGHDSALVKKFNVMVTKCSLKIRFVGRSLPMHSGARVCAIEIKSIR